MGFFVKEFTRSVLEYWRISLADSALGKGRALADDKLIELNSEVLKTGRLDQELVKRLFKNKSKDVETTEVRFWPFMARLRVWRGQAPTFSLPKNVAPVVTSALLTRDGYLCPFRVIVPRDLLEPLPVGGMCIGSVDDLDSFLTQNPFRSEGDERSSRERWQSYLRYVEDLRREVTANWPSGNPRYELTDFGLLEPATDPSPMIERQLSLYDHILDHEPTAPLMERFIGGAGDPVSPVGGAFEFASRLGHSNPDFPLADHQRAALSRLSVIKDGEVLAVNGPPGTGKTTMLLSAIAGEWARAALVGDGPPVIVAASTNNQAVTNIIDAFGKDFKAGDGPFGGRWLPDISSFGVYWCSSRKLDEVSKKYQTDVFFEKIETEEYVASAGDQYLNAAKKALPEADCHSLETVTDALQGLIREEVAKLDAIDAAGAAFAAAQSRLWSELGDDPEAELQARRFLHKESVLELEKRRNLSAEWDRYCAGEPIWLSLLAFIPPIAVKRALLARVFLMQFPDTPEAISRLNSVRDMQLGFESWISQAKGDVHNAAVACDRGGSLFDEVATLRQRLADAIGQVGGRDLEAGDWMQADRLADTGIRFRIFLLATHYWEGRWLIEMQKALPGLDAERRKTGRKTVEARLRRRMMLTPCAVSTFALLPNRFKCSCHVDGDFVTDYLFDFMDLLIVDEAGQVLPEIAGASMSLARKALIIGDTQQLEPISTLTKSIDLGNLVHAGLMPDSYSDDDWQEIIGRGIPSSTGSAMKLAQLACSYHDHSELDRGLYLFEHRRCYDEIISFCNILCYKGALIPKRGRAPSEDNRPPFSYLHIEGHCVYRNGSRVNLLEAKTIAAWLQANRENIEGSYGKKLETVVAVLTPFSSQKAELERVCREYGFDVGADEGQMTVGTVHSLQGAERGIVIFSPTYSKHANGEFIDWRLSMLNVAVSRAKDQFLVFGDMDLFTMAPPGTPRSVLASVFSRESAIALDFETLPRDDLVGEGEEFKTLRDAEQHDGFLISALNGSARKISVVSPWIYIATMKQTGILDAMQHAVANGKKVEVYADSTLSDQGRKANRSMTFMDEAEAELDALGVSLFRTGQVHSKIVWCDDSLLCIGSFNWLSASREGEYRRHETSLVYTGKHLAKEIDLIKSSLDQRVKVRGQEEA